MPLDGAPEQQGIFRSEPVKWVGLLLRIAHTKVFSKVVLMMSKKNGKTASTFIRHKHKEYMVLLQG
jgi:hypothetical protein